MTQTENRYRTVPRRSSDAIGCRYSLILFALVGLIVVINPTWNVDCDAQESLRQSKHSKNSPIDVVVEKKTGHSCFVVKNLKSPESIKVLVWLDGANTTSNPPMAGSTTTSNSNVIFKPTFPLRAGASYFVDIQTKDGNSVGNTTVTLAAEKRPIGRVIGIYPSSNKLPENTLKFYVHFSSAMRKGDIYRFVKLKNADGEEVELPFLEIEQEFWSRDSKRLTLLLDPGRIKRGLRPRKEMGPILIAGRTYDLIISGDWPDANGKQQGNDFVKRFQAYAEDHAQPNPSLWKIKHPNNDTRESIEIDLKEPLDQSMLMDSISVHSIDPQSADSRRINGEISILNDETTWTFKPDVAWTKGAYKILIESRLEDLAGNSIDRQFDVDLFHKTERTDTQPIIDLRFHLK